MEIVLSQFAVLVDLERKLKEVTSAQISELEPGPYKDPDEVTIIGAIPDHLKALLVLSYAAVDKAQALQKKIRSTAPGPQKEKLENDLAEAKQEVEFLNAFFWRAVKAEYPAAKDYPVIGINEKHEIFGSTERGSSLAGILLGVRAS